jgi:hypothetical protein
MFSRCIFLKMRKQRHREVKPEVTNLDVHKSQAGDSDEAKEGRTGLANLPTGRGLAHIDLLCGNVGPTATVTNSLTEARNPNFTVKVLNLKCSSPKPN